LEKSSQEGGETKDFETVPRVGRGAVRSPLEYFSEPVSPTIPMQIKKTKII